MITGCLAEIAIGVKAEGEGLESNAQPLAVEDAPVAAPA